MGSINAVQNKQLRQATEFLIPFVYFLTHNQEIVYIGQTTHLGARLNVHRRKAWEFDQCFALQTGEPTVLESACIRHFKPKYNKFNNADWHGEGNFNVLIKYGINPFHGKMSFNEAKRECRRRGRTGWDQS